MFSPSSCLRCSKLLAAVTPGGLCAECVSTAQTGNLQTPAPGPGTPTGSANLHAPTATVALGTSRGLPQSPAGYEIIEWLGGGGMGEVYLARELASERWVAMKFLRRPNDPTALERFLLELRVLARLDHPNVVRVLASDFLRADPYFTMERMHGGSLGRHLDSRRPAPPAEAVRLIRQVAAGVAALHAENVVHRDLKPSNILLAADGTPKVADVGLAKMLDVSEGPTATTGGLGTAQYMPPEQVSRRNGEIGPWSDVYGLGATLYHLLTGCPPFTGDTSEEVIQRLLNDPPKRIRARRPDVPAALEGIVFKCLEKDPKDRYQTVAAFIADLDRYEAGERPLAPPLTPGRRLWLWARRNRHAGSAAVAVLALVAGAFVLGAAFRPVNAVQATPEQQDPEALHRAALRAGMTAVVIPDKGVPKGLDRNWLVHPTVLSSSTTADDACAYESLHPSLLAFLKDPGIDQYRITAQLRVLRSELVDPAKDFDVTEFIRTGVGLFLGHVSARGGDGSEVHAFLLVDFVDSLPPEVRMITKQAAVQPGGALIVACPNRAVRQAYRGWYPATRFPPAKELPGEWRVIQIEVRPAGVKFFWAERPGDPPQLLAEATADQLGTQYTELQNWVTKYYPAAGIRLPTWSPRAPFGVWSNGSAVAVRNVTVEPLR